MVGNGDYCIVLPAGARAGRPLTSTQPSTRPTSPGSGWARPRRGDPIPRCSARRTCLLEHVIRSGASPNPAPPSLRAALRADVLTRIARTPSSDSSVVPLLISFAYALLPDVPDHALCLTIFLFPVLGLLSRTVLAVYPRATA